MRRKPIKRCVESGEFLWLVSLSDLMILLFIFFVVMFSFTYKKINRAEFQQVVEEIRHQAPVANPADQMKRDFENVAVAQGLADQITVRRSDNAVLIEIKDQVLFASGEFTLHAKGSQVLRALSTALEKIPSTYRIGIEGHTDDVPIHTARISDNWDLSARRAISVLHALDLSTKALKRTVVMANGEMSPIAPNRDPMGRPIAENQSRNRRVTIRIF